MSDLVFSIEHFFFFLKTWPNRLPAGFLFYFLYRSISLSLNWSCNWFFFLMCSPCTLIHTHVVCEIRKIRRYHVPGLVVYFKPVAPQYPQNPCLMNNKSCGSLIEILFYSGLSSKPHNLTVIRWPEKRGCWYASNYRNYLVRGHNLIIKLIILLTPPFLDTSTTMRTALVHWPSSWKKMYYSKQRSRLRLDWHLNVGHSCLPTLTHTNS